MAPWVIALAGLIAATLAGAALVRDVKLGLAFVAVCGFLPLVALNLPLAIAAWVPIAWIDYSHVSDKAPLVGTLLLLVAWIGTRRLRGAVAAVEPSVRIARVALVLSLVWITLSISWASDRGDAWFEVRGWCTAAIAFLLVSTVATTPARVRLIALAFVAGALVSIVVGLTGSGLSTTASALDLATRERFSGGAGDPNYLAAGLIAAIALAAGLLASVRDPVGKLLLVAAVLAMTAAIAATQSRGGLVAAVAAVLAALVLARERRAGTLAFGVFAAAAVTVFLLLSHAGWHRVTSFDAGGTGRTQLWRVALRMTGDHPIAGVGIRGYEHEAGHYVRRPGSLTFVARIAEQPVVTHDVYLQQLAETGVVGLVLLLAAFGGCVAAAQTAAGRFRAAGDGSMDALARSVTVAMIGLLAASAFISNSTDKRLWIVLALGPALLAAAGGATRAAVEPQSTER